ncbi:MAG: hypothetical protein HQ569_02170 [Actinobacteria bacterium]|nr:hypothetical protein [Actinomycetota bacterium]
MIRKNFLVYLNTSLIALFFIPSVLNAQLKITLSLDKDTYLEDESIWFEAVEENIGDETMYSSYFLTSAKEYCKVILKDSEGKELQYKGGMGNFPYRPEYPGYKVEPGQKVYLINNLLAIFGERDENHRFVFRLPPGRYSLQVMLNTNYHWLYDLNEKYKKYGAMAYDMVDKGTIFSNIVEFKIIKSTGIEKEVQDKLLQAYRLTYQIKQGSSIGTEIFPILKSIVDNYPESAYVIAAHSSMPGSVANSVGYTRNQVEEAIRFKDRIYCYTLTSGLNKELSLQKFPELKSKHPDSKLAEYIDHYYKYGRLKEVRE